MVNPEIVELRQQQNAQGREITEIDETTVQINKYLSEVSRQATLQIAIIVLSFPLTMAVSLYYQIATLDRRIEQIEKKAKPAGRDLDQLDKELRNERQAK